MRYRVNDYFFVWSSSQHHNIEVMSAERLYELFLDERLFKKRDWPIHPSYMQCTLTAIHHSLRRNDAFWWLDNRMNEVMRQAIAHGLYNKVPSAEETFIFDFIRRCLDQKIAVGTLLPPAGFYKSFGKQSRIDIARFVDMISSLFDSQGLSLPAQQVNNMKVTKGYLIDYYKCELSSTENKRSFLDRCTNPGKALGQIFAANRGVYGTREGALNRLLRVARDRDGIVPPAFESNPEPAQAEVTIEVMPEAKVISGITRPGTFYGNKTIAATAPVESNDEVSRPTPYLKPAR